MRIVKIEEMDKVRRKVYLEEGPVFWLYRKDVSEYRLQENSDLSEECYERIRKEKVLVYAKKKLLELLERMDHSEQELRNKLQLRVFSPDIIDEAILYAKQFHYIDDLRYAINFIQMKSSIKSKKQITYLLYQKGITKDCVEQAYQEFLQREQDISSNQEGLDRIKSNPEIAAIEKLINRKGKPIDEYTKEELQKLTASLYRKGFSTENIRFVLSCDLDL